MPPPPQQSDAHLISVLLFDVCIQFVEVPLLLRYYLDSDIYHLFCLSFHPLNSKDDETYQLRYSDATPHHHQPQCKIKAIYLFGTTDNLPWTPD